MADPITLAPRAPLDGYDRSIGGMRLREITDLAIVSLAVPIGEEGADEQLLVDEWGENEPDPGRSTLSGDGTTRLIWTAPDQFFALFQSDAPDASVGVHDRFGESFYVTLQTDAWVALELAGPDARRALERICPLDMHRDAFPVDAAARTVMEHMGAFVIRTADDTYLLLSASSSAGSFLHAVEQSVANISGD